ncbi:MAG TPA: hypothetical protein VGV67_04595 [Solirubrobacteraceae bacterium]|nr:hypothetical protein [Solirubrobacteraceae bacterium]
MSMQPGQTLPPDDDDLMAELRQVVAQVDPVPEAVRIAARAAIEWRTLETELAALVHDSAVDEPALAVRGAASGPRTLTFEAGELTIEVAAEPSDDAGTLCLVGQLVPPQAAAVAVRHGDELIAVRADDRGRFAVRGVAPGRVSLRCRLDAGPGAGRLVETAWLTV